MVHREVEVGEGAETVKREKQSVERARKVKEIYIRNEIERKRESEREGGRERKPQFG